MPKSDEADKQGLGATAGATAPGGSNNDEDKKNNNNANNKGKSQDSGDGSNNNNKNHRESFKGRTAEMHGHVFKLPTKANQYSTMVNIMKEYVGKTYPKTAGEMMVLFKRTPTMPAIAKGTANPVGTELDGSVSVCDKKMWELLLDKEMKQQQRLKQNMLSFFQVIMGQCNKVLMADLNGEPDFTQDSRTGTAYGSSTKSVPSLTVSTEANMFMLQSGRSSAALTASSRTTHPTPNILTHLMSVSTPWMKPRLGAYHRWHKTPVPTFKGTPMKKIRRPSVSEQTLAGSSCKRTTNGTDPSRWSSPNNNPVAKMDIQRPWCLPIAQ